MKRVHGHMYVIGALVVAGVAGYWWFTNNQTGGPYMSAYKETTEGSGGIVRPGGAFGTISQDQRSVWSGASTPNHPISRGF